MDQSQKTEIGKIVGAAILILDILVIGSVLGVRRATGAFVGAKEFVSGEVILLLLALMLVIYIISMKKHE